MGRLTDILENARHLTPEDLVAAANRAEAERMTDLEEMASPLIQPRSQNAGGPSVTLTISGSEVAMTWVAPKGHHGIEDRVMTETIAIRELLSMHGVNFDSIRIYHDRGIGSEATLTFTDTDMGAEELDALKDTLQEMGVEFSAEGLPNQIASNVNPSPASSQSKTIQR